MAGGDRGGLDGIADACLCVAWNICHNRQSLTALFLGEVVAVDDVGLIDAMDWQMD